MFSQEEDKLIEIPDVWWWNDYYAKNCYEVDLCQYQDELLLHCTCDPLCDIFEGCCRHAVEIDSIDINVKRSQIKCKNYPYVSYHRELYLYSYYVIQRCSELWTDDTTRQLCENEQTFLKFEVPVSNNLYPELVFRNEFCAKCNYFTEYTFWTVDAYCIENNTNNCIFSYSTPDLHAHARSCDSKGDTGWCPKIYAESNVSFYRDLDKNCSSDYVEFVYDGLSKYKNVYCAVCNGVTDVLSLGCTSFEVEPVVDSYELPEIYSFRIVVDFNNEFKDTENNVAEGKTGNCSRSEIFDPHRHICRALLCSDYQTIDNCPEKYNRNTCAYVLLESSEFQIINNSRLYLYANERYFDESMFMMNGSFVYICQEAFIEIPSKGWPNTRVLESYLSIACQSLSIASLSYTLFIYAVLPDLLNIPNKNLISLVTTLLLAHSLLLFSGLTIGRIPRSVCLVIAVVTHYLFLATFTWTNVIAFDMLRTFSSLTYTRVSPNSKRFLKYSSYAWSAPMGVTLVALCFHFYDVGEVFDMGIYDDSGCWLVNGKAMLYLIVVPLACFKCFDITAFICTSFYIFRAKREGGRARKHNACLFFVYIKLSILTGIPWILGFIANFINNDIIWILFVVSISLQGVYITSCFSCSPRIWHRLGQRCTRKHGIPETGTTPADTIASSRT